MPIICKISLDASEYKAQLQSAVEETRNFQGSLDDAVLNVSADTGEVQEAVDSLPQAQDQSITISVEEQDAKESILQVNDSAEKLNNTVKDAPVEGFSGKFKKALASVRAELNKTAGGAGKFLETFLAGGGGIGIIAAGVASLGKIATTVYNNWRQKLQENSEQFARNAESIRETAAANEENRQKTDGYLSRLQELSTQENLSNTQKREAKKLIDDLSASYGELGITLDEVTGKLNGVDAATVKKMQQDKSRRIAEIDAELKQIRADKLQQIEIRDTAGIPVWFDGDTRVGGKEEIEAASKKIEELDQRANELNKKKIELKQSDDVEEFLARKKAEVADLKKSLEEQQAAFRLKQADDTFASAENNDEKIANRREQQEHQ